MAKQEAEKKYRVRRVLIHPKEVARFLQGESEIISGALPKTVFWANGAWDYQRGCFVLFVEDESFDEVDVGAIPPEHQIIFREKL